MTLDDDDLDVGEVPASPADVEPLTLWICGKIDELSWELQGVFDSEQRAIEACRTDDCFVGPVVLNTEFPIETSEWEGMYYPHLCQDDDADESPGGDGENDIQTNADAQGADEIGLES